MTLFGVEVEQRQTKHLLIEAPSVPEAVADAMELALDLEWDDGEHDAWASAVSKEALERMPAWTTYWTGGADGEFRMLSGRDK